MNLTNSKYILLLGLKISCQDGRHQKEDAEHEGEEKNKKNLQQQRQTNGIDKA